MPYSFPNYPLKTEMPVLPSTSIITAKVIADSYYTNLHLHRATTLELEFPRFILAELNTHRVFSKNASSSRAIPTLKQIDVIQKAPVFPVRWGKNQPGMRASQDNLSEEDQQEANRIWMEMVNAVAEGCKKLTALGVHKQWASRPLEWASTIKVVLTGTTFENFFHLRDHPDAQDEMIYLTQAVKTALNESTPKELKQGEWHLPYVSEEEFRTLGLNNALAVSASRCARTSYKTHHGVTSTLEDDLALFKKLTYGMDIDNEDNPFHASPMEHQLTPSIYERPTLMSGNSLGWTQFRKLIEFKQYSI